MNGRAVGCRWCPVHWGRGMSPDSRRGSHGMSHRWGYRSALCGNNYRRSPRENSPRINILRIARSREALKEASQCNKCPSNCGVSRESLMHSSGHRILGLYCVFKFVSGKNIAETR
jgi:hypothetical protein